MSQKEKQDAAWLEASTALGFTLMEDTIGNRGLFDFGMMRSALAPLTTVSRHNWMVGKFRGRDVLVSYYFQDGGSSSDTHETYVFAGVDPPLFLGLEVGHRGFLCAVPKLLGVPVFDDKFRAQSFLPERAFALLRPGREPPIADLLLEAAGAGYHPFLVDSYASVRVDQFEAAPAFLVTMLERATRLAAAMEARGAVLDPTSAELHERNEWAQFADVERMTFDPRRRTIRGKYRGHDATIWQKTMPSRAFTLAQLSFPVSTDLDLTIKPEDVLTRLANMIGFSDLVVGNAAFDREFRIKAEPKSLAERPVRALLQTDGARDAVAAIVRKYGEFRLRDRAVFVSVPPARAGAQIYGALAELAAFMDAVTGIHHAPPQGPYRK